MADNKDKTPNIKSEADIEREADVEREVTEKKVVSHPDLVDKPKTEEQTTSEDLHFESKDIQKADTSKLFVNVSDAEKIARAKEQKRIENEKALAKKMVSTYRERMKGHRAEYKKNAREEKKAENKEKINRYVEENRKKLTKIRNSLIALAVIAIVVFLGVKFGPGIVTDIKDKQEAATVAKQKEERTKEHSENIEEYKDDYETIKAMAYKYAEYNLSDAVLYLQAAIDKYDGSDNNAAKACLHATRASLIYNDHMSKKIQFTDEEKEMILSDAKAAFEYEPTRQRARLAREYATGLGEEQLAEEYDQKYKEAKE